MKQKNSVTKHSPEPVADLYQDETMAMVYVGDVYSLVAQQGAAGDKTSSTPVDATEPRAEKLDGADDDGNNDSLRPYIR